MHHYDKSSKWLIQHFGDSILRLAGVRDFSSWQPLAADLVQPRRLPDGLIEVRRSRQTKPDLYIVEIATYPEPRVAVQVAADTAMVYLDHRVLPEVVVLFLHPRGKVKALGNAKLRSPRGLTDWRLSWRIAKLWEVRAQELLATGDIGVIPWVPLTKFDGPPEPIIRQCRVRIDRDAPPAEHENLLAVTQVLTRLRYNDPRLFQILGGDKAMIESPLLDELRTKWTQEATRETKIEDLTAILVARFGAKAEALETEIKAVGDDARLKELVKHAATCRTVGSFRKLLAP